MWRQLPNGQWIAVAGDEDMKALAMQHPAAAPGNFARLAQQMQNPMMMQPMAMQPMAMQPMVPMQPVAMQQQAPWCMTPDQMAMAAAWARQMLNPMLAQNVKPRAFNVDDLQTQLPTREQAEQLGMGTVTLAASASGSLSQTVQKPCKIVALRLFGVPTPADLNSAIVTAINVAGKTLTATAGEIPAAFYALVDSWGNLTSDLLLPGQTIVINIRNANGAAGITIGGVVQVTAAE
jgi:hypothetical protein